MTSPIHHILFNSELVGIGLIAGFFIAMLISFFRKN